MFGRNKERYQYLSEQGIPDPEAGKGYNRESCEKHGFHTIVTGFGWVYQVREASSMLSVCSAMTDLG